MQIHHLSIGSFRLFQEKSLSFEPGLNLITGENAIGKTTLLEALYLLMAGRSFRSLQMSDLIKEGGTFFRVETHFEKWGVSQHLKLGFQGTERLIHYNSSVLSTLSGLLGILQGVLLAPHDIELIKGSPAVRRHYLDFQIAQVDPLYIHHLTRYSKALKQRNVQIRSRRIGSIEVFEEIIAGSASYIISQREAAAADLSCLLNRYYQKISGKEEESVLRYHSSFGAASSESILKKLQGNRMREMDLGYTHLGVHRDDFSLLISGRQARHFASEGEMRSLAAALKLAEWERMREITNELPLLFVDDIGISLDNSRLHGLYQIFDNMGQVIITSATNNFSFIKNMECNIIKM